MHDQLSRHNLIIMFLKGKTIVAHYDEKFHAIHFEDCELLVQTVAKVCYTCKQYRQILNRLLLRATSALSDTCHPKSHANYRYLHSPEKCQRLKRSTQQRQTIQ